MKLIIVESPTKAKTLARFLNGKYQVEATMGHIRDLPKASLGVDVEHDFTPQYVIPTKQRKRATELVAAAQKAEGIILATDPDREGEAIAWHVASIMNGEGSRSKKKVKKVPASHSVRIVFHEITQAAIAHALENPRQIDLKLVNAQQARRVLDRLVGYKLSPLLWQKLSKRWLSAGRVQSVAVRLVVEREREIAKFTAEDYWTIEGTFNPTNESIGAGSLDNFEISAEGARSADEAERDRTAREIGQVTSAPFLTAQLVAKDGVKYEKTLTFDLFDGKYTTTKTTIATAAAAQAIVADLSAPFTISAVDQKEVKRYPQAPYTTSTLQQEAGRRLYFSAKKTMQLAQQLYEEGLITYHRTDSVNLAEKFIGEARQYLGEKYGANYVPATPRRYQTKSKVAQEAHEAVRPTNLDVAAEALGEKGEFNRDHQRLYDLIWKRALGSQAAEAIFDATTISLTSANDYRFAAQGSVVKFDGFLRIVGRDTNGDVLIPKVAVGDQLALIAATPTAHATLPPPRYTEASLIKTLEEKGIGRPSTYAPIISTIVERQYVTKEEKKLIPTELGNAVTDFLVQYFPDIMDLPFTAKMEDSLDAIANGQEEWIPVIAEFYKPFAQRLEETYTEATKVKMPEETINEACPQCGSPLVIRIGRYGKFIACSTFPKCDYTRQLVTKIDQKCPRCGGDIVIKKSRRGKTFYGCSNYPQCTFAAWRKEDIK